MGGDPICFLEENPRGKTCLHLSFFEERARGRERERELGEVGGPVSSLLENGRSGLRSPLIMSKEKE